MKSFLLLLPILALLTSCDKIQEWKHKANATSIPGIEYGMTENEVIQHLPAGYTVTFKDESQITTQTPNSSVKKQFTFQDGKLIIVSNQ
jgi:hypothetical protein